MAANQDIKETSTPATSAQVSTPATSVATTAVSAVGVGASTASLLGFNSVDSGFKPGMPNVLHKYASYNTIFTLAILTPNQTANPEKTYLRGEPLPIILRSAGGNPTNRVKTAFGKFDFYITDLEIKSIYGFTQGLGNTNATLLDFTVAEPFSMGMFPISLNTAARSIKPLPYKSFTEATFLLKIEFMGEDQNGNMVKIKNTTKWLPIQFRRVDMSVTEGGATYKCQAHAAGDAPNLRSNSRLLTNVTIKGSTVQEILQRGPSSLQSVINGRLRETAKKAGVKTADEIVILFPEAAENLKTSTPGEDETETKAKAKAAPNNSNKTDIVNDSKILSALNVSRGNFINGETLIENQVNAIGASSLGYDAEKKAKTAAKKAQDMVDKTGKVDQAFLNKNFKVSEWVLPQDSTILGAVNQIIQNSNYAVDSLKAESDKNGMKKWWRVETAVYELDAPTDEKSGTKPKVFVYKVVPYMYHESNFPTAGVSSPTFTMLLNQCIKIYNYIFTGKNQDILKFNLDFDTKFMVAITNDFGATQKEPSTQGGKPAPPGGQPGGDTNEGSWGYKSIYSATHTTYERQGKGGDDTPANKSARMMHDALTYGYDLQNIEIDIVGDPYYLTSNGMGNYNNPPDAKMMNILKDGSINFQNGEVDIAIIFKTPLDINSSTGLYTMSGKAVGQFSGLYKLQTVTHKFKEGQFTQTIKGVRRPMTKEDTKKVVFKEGGDRGTRGGA
jgi:hypothetical protein